MLLKKKIEQLLKSKLSGYRIWKDTSVHEQSIDYFRNNMEKIGNMRLNTAEILGRYYCRLKKERKI